ncbi:MAG: FMN-binding glutamate synthase family protein [Thermoleophilia bacterium]|nr:FMN-binding glutamate synthase family protein [Thermoleophilia bacterium]
MDFISHPWQLVLVLLIVALVALVIWDITQRRHAILRNFPLLGHFRYLLELVGPELRQYIVTGNDEERPFSRDQRTWVYASSKEQNNYSGFGTDSNLETMPGQIIIRPRAFPLPSDASGPAASSPLAEIPFPVVIGERTGRTHAFRPQSAVNISGMSFGALGPNAVKALNIGAARAGVLQDTGEGGLTSYHDQGGELILQIGTGYFGVRDDRGRFDLARLNELVARYPVRAIEIKLSQGAKPGHGGILPAVKVTPQIAEWRGVKAGVDCVSPPTHAEFHDVPTMIEFIELIADNTGLPVGIKSAVGEFQFWDDLAAAMARDRTAGPDFIVVDGGEGGTGAAPFVFADHVSLPFKAGFAQVFNSLARVGMQHEVALIGSGKLGFPETALMAMSLGAHGVNVGREAMLSIGCIQAQRCHTDHCPTGVATQSPWRNRGLVPESKGERCGRYLITLRHEMLDVTRVCRAEHPRLIDPSLINMVVDNFTQCSVHETMGINYDDIVMPTRQRDALLAHMGAPSSPTETPAAGEPGGVPVA